MEYYSEKEIGTKTFTVSHDESGECKIRFDAVEHKGSFNITWEIK